MLRRERIGTNNFTTEGSPSFSFSHQNEMSEWRSNDTLGLWLTAGAKRLGERSFVKIAMTSGRRNLHSPTPSPTPLLIFDRRPPTWYKFLSLISLPLPLKSKAARIFVKNISASVSADERFTLLFLSIICSFRYCLYDLQKNISIHVTRITLRMIKRLPPAQ